MNITLLVLQMIAAAGVASTWLYFIWKERREGLFAGDPSEHRSSNSWQNWLSALSLFYRRRPEVFSALHALTHDYRDLVMRMAQESILVTYRPSDVDAAVSPHPMLTAHKLHLQQMLDHVSEIFQATLPGGAKVVTELRDLRDDAAYHRFLYSESSPTSKSRQSSSLPLTDSLVKALRLNFAEGREVIVAETEGTSCRSENKNDEILSNYVSTMIGAVMANARKSDKETQKQMAWTLAVCCDKPEVFSDSHKVLMRSCVDLFSAVATSMLSAPVRNGEDRISQ